MDELKAKISQWTARLKTELMRDKKKTSVLLALTVVALIVVVKLLAGGGGGAGAARAVRPAVAAAAEAAGETDEQTAEQLWQQLTSEGSTDQAERERYLAAMDRNITRDLFQPNPELYPPSGTPSGPGPVAPSEPGWFADVGQWVWQKQQAQQEEMAHAAVIRAQARGLALQSTMLGSPPTALINGQVLGVGDSINGFLVKGIASDNCVVSKEGVDVQLRLES